MEGEKKRFSDMGAQPLRCFGFTGFVLLIMLAAITYIIVLGKILRLMIQTKDTWVGNRLLDA